MKFLGLLLAAGTVQGTELEDVLTPEIIANTWGVGDPEMLRPVRPTLHTVNAVVSPSLSLSLKAGASSCGLWLCLCHYCAHFAALTVV